MRIILFDIDGTLIDSGGAGTKAMNLAFKEMFGIDNGFKDINMAGKTDPQIFKECLEKHGIENTNRSSKKFFEYYTEFLKQNIKQGTGHVKPGVVELLNHLEIDHSFITGLLTGNIEDGAKIKLGHFDLLRYFEAGAFGSDDDDRNRLFPVAASKISKIYSCRAEFRDFVVIGDTPRDITCSKPYGALSVAVATGPYSYEELSNAGADIILKDMSDTRMILEILRK